MRLEHVIHGDDSVQRHVASERAKRALLAVSPMARKAIKLEVLPQIEESVLSADGAEDLCNETKRAIEAAFSYKNPLYTRLVSYKGIEQSDEQFLADLLVVMDEWLRRTKAQLDDGQETSDKQEVEVKVKVEADTQQDEEAVQFHDSDEVDAALESESPAPPDVQFHVREDRQWSLPHELEEEPELVQFQEAEEAEAPLRWQELVEDPVVLFGPGEVEQ